MILQLRRAPEPSQDLPPPPTPEPRGPGAAETLYSALKVSTQIRSSQLLKSILGLTDKNSLPTPQKTIELLQSRPGYQEAHREGLIGLILDPLVDQRLFESLMTKSRDSSASGVRHWIMFTEVLRIPPEKPLDVTAQDAARWLATFNVKSTAEAYRTH